MAAPDLAAAPPPVAVAPRPAIDWSKVHITSDQDALAVWRRIAPTGADWPERVSELPDDDEIIRPLAYAVIRGGNVTCAPQKATGCNAPLERSVADGGNFDDPCVRRELAKWSLAQLDSDNVNELRDGLVTLVSQPHDDELAGAVLEHLELLPPDVVTPRTAHGPFIAAHKTSTTARPGVREELVIAAYRAGNYEAVDGNLGALTDAELETLAIEHHIDGAVRQLDAEQSRNAYLEAIASSDFRAETRIRALHDLLELRDPRSASNEFRSVVQTAAIDANCVVAGAAVRALETLGVTTARLHRPTSTDVAASWRTLCMIASDPGDASGNHANPKILVGPNGLTTINHVYPETGATDDDTTPPLVNEKSTMARVDITDLPFAEEFAKVWSTCGGPTCPLADGGTISAHFTAANGGGLYLDSVEHSDGAPNDPAVTCIATPDK